MFFGKSWLGVPVWAGLNMLLSLQGHGEGGAAGGPPGQPHRVLSRVWPCGTRTFEGLSSPQPRGFLWIREAGAGGTGEAPGHASHRLTAPTSCRAHRVLPDNDSSCANSQKPRQKEQHRHFPDVFFQTAGARAPDTCRGGGREGKPPRWSSVLQTLLLTP